MAMSSAGTHDALPVVPSDAEEKNEPLVG